MYIYVLEREKNVREGQTFQAVVIAENWSDAIVTVAQHTKGEQEPSTWMSATHTRIGIADIGEQRRVVMTKKKYTVIYLPETLA